MTVYVAEWWEWDRSGILGVFASAEAAMKAYPGDWEPDSDGWEMETGHAEGKSIAPYEVAKP